MRARMLTLWRACTRALHPGPAHGDGRPPLVSWCRGEVLLILHQREEE